MKRVFLVGCPRSGTTWLQVMLASHTVVTSFPESHFFSTLLKGRGRWRRLLGLGNRHGPAVLRQFEIDVGGELPVGCTIGLAFIKPITGCFVKLLDAIAVERGKSIWIEKTPDHVFFIDHIQRLIPDSMFVHLTRDGREVVASLYEVSRKHSEVWGEPWSVDRCIDHWRAAVSRTLQALDSGQSHVLVRYEDLIEKPAAELDRLAAFLGIAVEREMLTRPRARSRGVVRREETWKANIYKSLTRPPLEKFREHFDELQRNYVSMRVEDLNLELAQRSAEAIHGRITAHTRVEGVAKPHGDMAGSPLALNT